ncbi:hypothetical protein [Sinorhizobium fredii]|uniref:hypothetical protein n=1 Tax=Rhizobium fredii TaxID=380 RepID=UPI003510EF16
MFKAPDKRLGKELGLSGAFSDVPAFQIVNDTHNLLLAYTSRLISLEYGPLGEALKADPAWQEIDAKSIEFSRRFDALHDDAVKAAQLADEIRDFTKSAVDPVVAFHEKAAIA